MRAVCSYTSIFLITVLFIYIPYISHIKVNHSATASPPSGRNSIKSAFAKLNLTQCLPNPFQLFQSISINYSNTIDKKKRTCMLQDLHFNPSGTFRSGPNFRSPRVQTSLDRFRISFGPREQISSTLNSVIFHKLPHFKGPLSLFQE